jgi:hypothetical protein
MPFTIKALLSPPCSTKRMHRWGKSKTYLIMFAFLFVLPGPVATGHAQALLPNPFDISFAAPVNYDVGSEPYSIFCADLDGDNDLDLAVTNSDYYDSRVSILMNNGDGTFADTVNYGVGYSPKSVFCADLDGDDDLDLAVANASGASNNVSILKNNGNGTFAPAVNYGAGNEPHSVFCADLDGDDDLDLAVANADLFSGNISILINDGHGNFDGPFNYAAGGGPYSVFCADLDGINGPDLAVANHWGHSLSILMNRGDGTFQPPVNYAPGGGGIYPNSVFCADLNGDHDMDVAVANGLTDNVWVLMNNGDGSLGPIEYYSAGDAPSSIFCADIDGDADMDLVVANESSNNVSILENNGSGVFSSAVNFSADQDPRSVFCADLDGDDDLDLAVANFSSNNVSILENLSFFSEFSPAVIYEVGSAPVSVFCADLDGGGDLDLAVVNSGSENVSILKNNGDGTFASAVNYAAGSWPRSVFCADLEGDADLDLAVANYFDDNVSILKNNGDGTFADAVNYGAGSYPRSVFCADLDDDADLDLAVANSGGDDVSILKNNGDGTFASAVNYGAGSHPLSVFCADLDGDGDPDLAVANSGSENVSILKNNGDGTFASAVNYGAGNGPFSIFCADLDGDGDLDLAVANIVSDNVSILKNLTQASANQPPWAFSLLSPKNGATTPGSATFRWRIPYDPNFGDQFRYDLYLSTTPGFESPTIIPDLPVSVHEVALEDGDYYWKVKARDNWGAETWSTETWLVQFHYMTDGMSIIAFSPVDLIVTDPLGDSISLWFNTIPDASYDTTTDYNQDGDNDDIVTLPDRLVGEYQIEVMAEPGGSGTYELGVQIDGGTLTMLTMPGGNPCPAGGVVDTFTYYAPWYKTGDATGDWKVDVGDVVYLINYLFTNGPAPDPMEAGDANCDGTVDIADVIYLINYLFTGGPAPC